jgi:hypothetical protein
MNDKLRNKSMESGILYTLQRLMSDLSDKADITTKDIVNFVQNTLDDLEENNRKDKDAN